MLANQDGSEARPGKPFQFQTTHWSAVLAAGQEDSPRRAEALEELCRAYWYPLYCFVRRHGYAAEDAEDLIQEFLARLVEKNWLGELEPCGGRFRSFLLTAVKRLLINDYDRSRAAKRGGGRRLISLDHEGADGRYLKEPVTDQTPEKLFDRRWALAVLERALDRLRNELSTSPRALQFELLSPFLSREAEPREYPVLSQRLGLTVGALGVAVFRLRQRYREVVREEIANTVANSAQVDEEMRHLFAALRG